MGAGMERLKMNENIGSKDIQTYSISNINKLVKMQFFVETKTKCLWGDAGRATVNCAPARRLKICRSIALLEPSGADWDGKMARTQDNKTQTCVKGQKRNFLWKPKQNYLCGEADDSIIKLCANQVTKKCVGGLTMDAVVLQVKPVVTGKSTVTF